jgi:hypothetical protein
VTVSVAYRRPIRDVVGYALVGGGLKSGFYKTVTTGLGAAFTYRGVPLYSEFRVYYPRQDLLSGIRLGLRF